MLHCDEYSTLQKGRRVAPGGCVSKHRYNLRRQPLKLRVRDGKLNADAEHRVPTGLDVYTQPNFSTASLCEGGFHLK